MTKPDDSNPSPAQPPPPASDLENRSEAGSGGGGGVGNILQRWRREDLLKRGGLALRSLGFVFSVLAFVIMASNKHGDWKDFDRYEEYRYVLAIAILSTLYTGLQAGRQFYELSTGREILLQRRNAALIDFVGDQIVAYLLISAASAAVPLTNRMREGADNIFTDSSAAAISMEFIAFFLLGLSALVSGYKLSTQTYI